MLMSGNNDNAGEGSSKMVQRNSMEITVEGGKPSLPMFSSLPVHHGIEEETKIPKILQKAAKVFKKFGKVAESERIPNFDKLVEGINKYFPKLTKEQKQELAEHLDFLRFPAKHLKDLLKVLQRTTFKFDIDGVLKSIPEIAKPYALAVINSLCLMNAKLVCLTNDGGSLEKAKADQLNGLGFKHITEKQICICTRSASFLAENLAKKFEAQTGKKPNVVFFGTDALREALDDRNLNPIPLNSKTANNVDILVIGEVYPRRDWTKEEELLLETAVKNCKDVVFTNTDRRMPVKLKNGKIVHQDCLGALAEKLLKVENIDILCEQNPKFHNGGKPGIFCYIDSDRHLREVYGHRQEDITRCLMVDDFGELGIKGQNAMEKYTKENGGNTQHLSFHMETGGGGSGRTKSQYLEEEKPSVILQNFKYFFTMGVLPIAQKYEEELHKQMDLLQKNINNPAKREEISNRIGELNEVLIGLSQERKRGNSISSQYSVPDRKKEAEKVKEKMLKLEEKGKDKEKDKKDKKEDKGSRNCILM
jgi:ribonucleotide monophosphatase NagD (HAD superfamily)